jgi:hypothetical protein
MKGNPVDDPQAARDLDQVGVDLLPGLDVAWLGVPGYRAEAARTSTSP